VDVERDDPTGRALALLSCFTSRAQWSGPELAERLGITTRTLRRDVERLRGLGYAIDAAPGTAGGYRLQAGAAVPPLFLDADEAVAAVTALLAAAGDETTGMVDASLRALAKLHHVLPVTVRRRADAVRQAARTAAIGHAPAVDPQHVAVLAESCRDLAAVRFGYRTRDGTPSQRRVEPNALVTVRSVWYLIGFDLDRDDWRMFRVDRIDGAVERTGHGATRRTVPGGDPLAFVGRSLAEMPHAHHADVHLAVARATALAANTWLNPLRLVSTGRHRCCAHLAADDLGDLTRQVIDLLALGPIASIETSDTVRRHLAGVARALDVGGPGDAGGAGGAR
jgi:predicted DNA-binding transcriptional regulator YafY